MIHSASNCLLTRRLAVLVAAALALDGPEVSLLALAWNPSLTTKSTSWKRSNRPPYSCIREKNRSWSRAETLRTDFEAPQGPQRFVRWHWDALNQRWDLQTAVQSFRSDSWLVELHALVHFANQPYFDYFNAQRKWNFVLYELLADEALLEPVTDWRPLLRGVSKNLSPSIQDQITAQRYGWTCQVDAIDYAQPNWFHADLSRQEFLSAVQQPLTTTQQPLWQVAKSPSVLPDPAAEWATALLMGPPVWQGGRDQPWLEKPARVPTKVIAQGLRPLLWVTVPSPELFILLLDWASLLVDQVSGISRVTWSILQLLLAGQLTLARQLVFGQVILGANSGSTDDAVLVAQRNQRALQVLDQLQSQSNNRTGGSIAILYGCSHGPDLHAKLVSRGYELVGTVRRTAWSVPMPQSHTGIVVVKTTVPGVGRISLDVSPRTATSMLVLVCLYLGIGGLDWIETLRDIVAAAQQNDAYTVGMDGMLYVFRHVLLYVGLSKFVLEWKDR
jgi:hypothetical protein